MQGRGTTNYASDKPSHELTTSTTQFDDELMKRGIVSMEQVMLAKGATPEEAQRLVEQKKVEESAAPLHTYDISVQQQQQQQQQHGKQEDEDTNTEDDDDDDDYLLDDDGDDLFDRYRQERMAQLDTSNSMSTTRSHVPRRISRDEWTSHVNEASQAKWVLVILWDDTTMRTQDIMQDLSSLLQDYSSWIDIVTIPYLEANPHWPSMRVPAMFAYKDGIKQNEFVTHEQGKFPTPVQLIHLLHEWGIVSQS